MIEVIGVSESIDDSLAGYVEEYEKVKRLIRDIKEGATLCVDKGDGVYASLDELFPDTCGSYIDKLKDDLQVYLIELRQEIRDILDEDEELQTGVVSGKKENNQPATVFPKNDYRRHTQEDKGDDLK